MGTEIERKFLVKSADFMKLGKGLLLHQGYLSRDPMRIVRVRTFAGQGFITIKSKTVGISRPEYEYRIAVEDAEEILEFCDSLIIKHRYEIQFKDHMWEVDVFHDANEGLVVAEIELRSETETFELPDWVGEEVTSDKRYNNANLIDHPFSKWGTVAV